MKRCTLYDSLEITPFDDREEERSWQKKAAELLKVLISSRLTRRQRQVIVLYYYKGMKQRDIAKKLNVSESAVSHAKATALKRIKFHLELLRG